MLICKHKHKQDPVSHFNLRLSQSPKGNSRRKPLAQKHPGLTLLGHRQQVQQEQRGSWLQMLRMDMGRKCAGRGEILKS